MSDTVMSVIAIFLAAILMFIFPLMSTADRNDDISEQQVQSETTKFADQIRAKGKITQDDYESFLTAIAQTGNSFDVEIEAKLLDENSRKKTSEASSTKVGENSYYSEYTSQIESVLNENGVYLLKEGDIVTVSVKNTNKTISQLLKNFFYQVTGNNTYNIAASAGGVVNVNGY